MSISRLGVVLKFGDALVQRLNQRFDFRDSVARRDVFGTVLSGWCFRRFRRALNIVYQISERNFYDC